MPILLDAPLADPLRRAHEFFIAFEDRVNNQRIFDAVKRVQCPAPAVPRSIQTETNAPVRHE